MGRRGFTLIEMLVCVALVAVAVVGVLGGIRGLTLADAKARKADLLQRLALRRMDELSVADALSAAQTSGDFSEQGYPAVSWTVDIQPSGVTDVDQVTVTASEGQNAQTLTGLFHVPPSTIGSTP